MHNAFVAAFLALQVLLPLRYYACYRLAFQGGGAMSAATPWKFLCRPRTRVCA